MTVICRLLLLGVMFFCLAGPVPAAEVSSDPSAQLAALQLENKELHQQLRQARRELAQLQSAEQQPGWAQVFGGVGIIFGVCGVAMMLRARKQKRD